MPVGSALSSQLDSCGSAQAAALHPLRSGPGPSPSRGSPHLTSDLQLLGLSPTHTYLPWTLSSSQTYSSLT